MNHIEQMCREHFNELLIAFDELGRLIGYHEDKYDCYLLIKTLDGKIRHHTAVGGYIFLKCLKGQGKVLSTIDGLVWNDYYRLEMIMKYRCPKEEEFILTINYDNLFEKTK